MKQFLRKMLFADLVKGLGVTFRNQSPKELITEQYPAGAAADCRAFPRRSPSQHQS